MNGATCDRILRSSPRKDNYKDLKLQQNEFKEEPSLQSYRVSGFLDVRRLAKARCETVSPGGLGALQDPKMGIQTGRIGGEGKKPGPRMALLLSPA